MKHTLFALLLICLVISVPGGSFSDEKEERPVMLRFKPLKDPDMILTQSDVIDSKTAGNVIHVKKGKVIPGKSISLKGTARLTLLIGGDEFVVHMKDDKPYIQIRGKDRRLKVSVGGCKPETLLLSNRSRYILSFPYADFTGDKPKLCYRSGAVMAGRMGRTPITLYDDNCDGRIVQGHDSIQMGTSLVFAPLGRLIPGMETVQQIDSLGEDGSEMKISPYTGATGKLVFNISSIGKGLELQLALKGKNTLCNYAGPVGRRPLVVAEDEYTIEYGLLVDARSQKIITGVMPAGLKPLKVNSGSETAVSLGGPLKFDFKPNVVSGNLLIEPNLFQLVGSGGERYTGFEIQGSPMVSVVINGQKKPVGSFETDNEGALKKFEKAIPRINGQEYKGEGDVLVTASVKGLGKISGTVFRKF